MVLIISQMKKYYRKIFKKGSAYQKKCIFAPSKTERFLSSVG